MAHTTVRDVVIWTKHVHGGNTAERLNELPGETEITLSVDGVRGRWCKMRDGKDGRPTQGLRPLGKTQTFWQDLFDSRRGASVSLEIASDAPEARISRSAVERDAARAFILSIPGRGWRSEGPPLTRDEMNERC